ncbi:MAG: DUF4476 domain-containing protein [Bacteroidota bacterium]
MKKLIAAMLFSTLITSAVAHHAGSRLRVHANDGSRIAVKLEGQWYHNNRGPIRIGGLVPGAYRVKVVKYRWSPAARREISQVVFNDVMRIPHNTRVVANVDRFNRINTRAVRLNRTIGRTLQGPHANVPPAVMDRQTFRAWQLSIEQARFERDRLALARRAVLGQPVTSAQVLQLMELMQFENSRLELAKLAYAQTVDPENYQLVYQAFRFGSSIRNLEQFINR